jgi:hypothetical protein
MRRSVWLWAVLMLGGCAPGNPGLFIVGALAPGDGCLFEAGNPQLTSGILDVSGREVRYVMAPLFVNQLLNLGETGAGGPPRADPNYVSVQEAQIELRDLAGDPLALAGLPNPFRVPATGFVPSSDGTTFGEGVGRLELIPAVYGDALGELVGTERGQIVASVRAVGYTGGGAEMVTGEFFWPIELCRGCLYQCVRNADGEALCQPTCLPGQDGLEITPSACVDERPVACLPGTG